MAKCVFYPRGTGASLETKETIKQQEKVATNPWHATTGEGCGNQPLQKQLTDAQLQSTIWSKSWFIKVFQKNLTQTDIYLQKPAGSDKPLFQGENSKPFESTFYPVVNNSSIDTYCRLVEQEAMSEYGKFRPHRQKKTCLEKKRKHWKVWWMIKLWC